MANILFIGLGNMGLPMALNLLKAKHSVLGFDISKDALARFNKQGGETSSSLSRDVATVDFVVTMLPSGQLVRDVLIEKEALFSSAKPGTLFIDASTIDTETARSLAELGAKAGHPMLDAPVSGGTTGAANGTLTFMVGGDAKTLERAKPILECMGQNILHAGPSGSGQTVKACNNMLLAIHMIGTAEAMNLGVSLGMDPKVLAGIMGKSSGANWSLSTYNPYPGVLENAPSSRDYTGGFAVDLMSKDLGLAVESALKNKVSIPLGHAAYDLYRIHAQAGSGHFDFSSIIRLLKPQGPAEPAKGV